jgi:hypothetical protein
MPGQVAEQGDRGHGKEHRPLGEENCDDEGEAGDRRNEDKNVAGIRGDVERYAALFIAQGLLLVLYDGLPE